MKVNLGCPRYCNGWLCVDIEPKEIGVIKWEAVDWLKQAPEVWEIKTENLLEHMPNVQEFIRLCYERLAPSGELHLVTDNAEWFPFYLPFDIPHTGIGAHSVPSYSRRFNVVHVSIFTKMHLEQQLRLAGFTDIKVRRMWEYLGARLQVVAIK